MVFFLPFSFISFIYLIMSFFREFFEDFLAINESREIEVAGTFHFIVVSLFYFQVFHLGIKDIASREI